MNEVGDEFRFADKILDEDLLIREILANDLDRYPLREAARATLLAFIDNAHASFAEFANDLVMEIALDREQSGHAREIVREPNV
jgi:hypothetical protein